ncbi:GNAT family N-acetyltransferase [Yersinia ruckeri]|nr:hypothetical protein [Yersinia ruckeri]EKN3345672.1 hypothetical protein [Yersinia ruckeri]EKN3361418.1 hypothetical protein [Yersinia ruckeri]EKN4200942.1 hypothetical protein [Yersinia ruckeri]EKN4207167.1 hypothetical protein [Yersinia ruckeri]EKN4705434.1 hypothetical protein [Yersinia ruckeri]
MNNKSLLLLYILTSIYSCGARPHDFISMIDIKEPLQSKGKTVAPICFYTEDHFQGEHFCLNPPEMIDLYNTENQNLNDKVSSIKIPDGMQVTIYKNDKFNAPHYSFTESVNLAGLDKIGMAGQISAIKTFEPSVLCTLNCVIIEEKKLELRDIINNHHQKTEDINNIILLNFDFNENSRFSVQSINRPQIIVVGRDLFFYGTGIQKPINMRLNNNTDNLSILLKFNDHSLQFQYVEAKGTERLNVPFWINTKLSPDDLANLYIINGIPGEGEDPTLQNSNPLILNRAIIAINKHPHRDKRGALGIAGCFGLPLLAIFNYVIQGHCNQLDELVGINEFSRADGKGKTWVLTDSVTPLPAPEQPPNLPADNPTPSILQLASLNMHLHHQALTLPAVAKACKTSIEEILSARYPRQTGIRCGSRLSSLLADFTLLFGENIMDWTTTHLVHVIQQINEHGTTGYAGSDQEAENRLVEGVQQAISTLGIEPLIAMMQDAFDYAQLNYVRYFIHNASQETLASPRAAQNLPLGSYILPLENYIHPQEPPTPLIRDNNQWVRPEGLYFEVTVIPGGDRHIETNLTEEIAEVVTDWFKFYSQIKYESDKTRSPLTDKDRTIYAARVTSHMLSDLLHDNTDDYQFVVVKLKGKIISVLASRNDDNGEDSYLSLSITHPQYVLKPHEEGSVRGAGTAAVRELARYLKEKGKKTLKSNVISQPSAIVKNKLGFQFQDPS